MKPTKQQSRPNQRFNDAKPPSSKPAATKPVLQLSKEEQEELKPLIKALRNRKQFHMLKALKRLRKLEEKDRPPPKAKAKKGEAAPPPPPEDPAAKLERKRTMAALEKEVEEIKVPPHHVVFMCAPSSNQYTRVVCRVLRVRVRSRCRRWICSR
jgi:hypothetical protein